MPQGKKRDCMLKNIHILPASRSAKRLLSRAKIALAANLSLGLIIFPTNNVSAEVALNQANTQSLIIPQEKLDTAFNVAADNQIKIQTPLSFFYISQGYSSFHPALDFAAKYATAVRPIAKGVVTEAGYSPFGYGNKVVIVHPDGLQSLYAHLSKITVKKGDEVELNSIIGFVGATGHATGPHLHLEISKDKKNINPLTVLPPLAQDANKLLTIR
jgi:murein DD-endopeptidase MepM/ murein hydrolase activator NlpD